MITIITVAIVDDEYLGRKRIKNLLEKDNRFQLIADCGNSTEAVSIILEKKPEVLFLDIEMPGLDGFELTQKIKSTAGYDPILIFITAHESYALNAYDVAAIDYLRKPFKDERFATSLQRIVNALELKTDHKIKDKIQEILKVYSSDNSGYSEILEVKSKGITRPIPLNKVLYFESYGNYVKIHMADGIELHRMPLKELEELLNPLHFTRISRFVILYNRAISSAHYKGQGEYLFDLYNGEKVTSTSLYKSRITNILKHLDLKP